jgi:hypothetical protein
VALPEPDTQLAAVTRACLDLSVSVLEGHDVAAKVDQMAAAAAGWARLGVPLDTVLHWIHEAFNRGLDRMTAQAGGAGLDLVARVKSMVERLDAMSSAVARVYVCEHWAATGGRQHAAQRLAATLLSGFPAAPMARECGITLAEEFFVMALAIPRHHEDRRPAACGGDTTPRPVRLQIALAERCGENALALLGRDGGTILIPTNENSDEALDDLVAQLSVAAGTAITSSVVNAPIADVPSAAQRAHELLDIACRVPSTPKLYRFSELALEYQLTRPARAANDSSRCSTLSRRTPNCWKRCTVISATTSTVGERRRHCMSTPTPSTTGCAASAS